MINCEKLVTNEEKVRYINKIAKQVDRKQGKISLSVLANKIKKEVKSKAIKN